MQDHAHDSPVVRGGECGLVAGVGARRHPGVATVDARAGAGRTVATAESDRTGTSHATARSQRRSGPTQGSDAAKLVKLRFASVVVEGAADAEFGHGLHGSRIPGTRRSRYASA